MKEIGNWEGEVRHAICQSDMLSVKSAFIEGNFVRLLQVLKGDRYSSKPQRPKNRAGRESMNLKPRPGEVAIGY